MRQTRRGCFAARKEPKYVWAVYAVETGYGADETTAPYTGSFTLSSSTRYKMAASAYTATATQFTLTNPVQKTRSQLAVGDYLVNVSTSSSTAVTGGYLYKITSISGNTFAYTRWQPAAYQRKTGAELYRVSSDTQDYPVDGAQDGYWYVMLKGYRTMYVWDVFNLSTTYTEDTVETASYKAGKIIYSYRADFNSVTGQYTIKSVGSSYTTYIQQDARGYYIACDIALGSGSHGHTEQYSVGDVVQKLIGYMSYSFYQYSSQAVMKAYFIGGIATHSKGDSDGTTVESLDQSAYPQDGVSGDRWYTYSHSYSKPFDDR